MREKNLEPDLESGAFTFFNNRICVRRDFRLTDYNKRMLEKQPYKKSDVLYMALNYFFRSDIYLGGGGATYLVENLDYKKAVRANLWVEYKHDIRLKELKSKGVSLQTVLNLALALYFKNV